MTRRALACGNISGKIKRPAETEHLHGGAPESSGKSGMLLIVRDVAMKNAFSTAWNCSTAPQTIMHKHTPSLGVDGMAAPGRDQPASGAA